jgi:hypothetical protein
MFIMWKSAILYTVLIAFAAAVEGQWDASRYLYWTTAADKWSSTAPIGNGRVAASIYGGASEQLSLTENSIWSGPWSNRASSKALGAYLVFVRCSQLVISLERVSQFSQICQALNTPQGRFIHLGV